MNKSSGEIFSDIVSEMGYDNGCSFKPDLDHLADGAQAVAIMRARGCEFTEDEIHMLAAGEVSEVEELFCRYAGWEDLNKVLIDVFEGELK